VAAQVSIDLSKIDANVLYTPRQCGEFLGGRSEKTLANERAERRGVPVTYIGARPFYRGADIIKTIERGRVDFVGKATPKRGDLGSRR
jgi:hypothetical protein